MGVIDEVLRFLGQCLLETPVQGLETCSKGVSGRSNHSYEGVRSRSHSYPGQEIGIQEPGFVEEWQLGVLL